MKIKYKLPETYQVRVLERHYRLVEVVAHSDTEAVEKAKAAVAAGEDVCWLEYSDIYEDSWEAEVTGPDRKSRVVDIGVQCAKRVADVYSKKGPAFMYNNYLTDVEENVIPMLEANLDNITDAEITTAKTAASWTAQAHLKSR